MRGDDALKTSPDAFVELDVRLGAGDDVPALLHEDLFEDRVALGRAAPELALFPFAEEDLAQIGYFDGCQSETRRKRRGRLVRTPEGRDVYRRDRFVVQSLREQLGLLDSHRVEPRVPVTLAARERLVGVRGCGLTMADEQQRRRAGRR